MADKRRFELFARFLVEHFPAPRIFDVAGGMGRLNEELTRLGRCTTTFDSRHKRLDVRYVTRDFTTKEPCECDLIVGLHPDGATRLIIEFAGKHRIPFAVIPCCSDNSMPYALWMRHLIELATGSGFTVQEANLPIAGRSKVLIGHPIVIPQQ